MEEKVFELAAAIAAHLEINTKMMLTADEAASYLGISKSYLYKLTMRRSIPFYKPEGKLVYFKRQELDSWLQRNRVATTEELDAQAAAYLLNKKGGAA